MSTILAVYQTAPNFPATDQAPLAVRYGPVTAGGHTYFVDVLNGPPTQAELDAFIVVPQTATANAVASKASYTADANFQAMLTQLHNATAAQIATAVQNNSTADAGTKLLLTKILLILGTLV